MPGTTEWQALHAGGEERVLAERLERPAGERAAGEVERRPEHHVVAGRERLGAEPGQVAPTVLLPGDPLRAGSSVNDIMGGMFGAIGAMAALAQRAQTGRGQEVQSALFENCVFLAAQHMQQFSMTGEPPPPMPSRVSAWSVYDVFTLADGEQLFIGAVSDKQFQTLCRVIEAWVFHFLQTRVRVKPIRKIEEARWAWHVGLDAESTTILNELWSGREVEQVHGRVRSPK